MQTNRFGEFFSEFYFYTFYFGKKKKENILCMILGYDHLDIENQLIAAQYLEEKHGSTYVYPEFHSLSLPSLTVSGNEY